MRQQSAEEQQAIVTIAQRAQSSRFGINHVGFLVSDMKAAIDGLASVVTIDSRPAARPYAEFRFRDPEGNALDLSRSKGWEVDVNKWERAA
ncbi:MAG: VOC family protein [Candidatus Binatia bacterium]